jgi:hypothetical protein
MAGKFTLLLTKREAETYRSHGLHKEAMAIYTSFLSSTSHIDPELKRFVQTKINEIEADMAEFNAQRESGFTAQDISRIMQTWGDSADETDRLVCVHALCSVGSYADALAELKRLIIKNGCRQIHLGPMIDCLTNLFTPAQISAAVDDLATECLPDQDARLAFRLALAENLARRSDRHWAVMLYRHLQSTGELPTETAAAVGAALENLEKPDETASNPDQVPNGDPDIEPPKEGVSSFFSRILKRFRTLFRALDTQ